MKILFVTQPWHEGIPAVESSQITIRLLAEELRNRNHEVDILATKKIFPKMNKKYDIVHGFSASPLLALRTWYLGLKSCACKTIHTIKSESVKGKIGNFFLNFVDVVTFPTKILRDKHKFKYGRIVRSNIDLKKFKPKKIKKDIDVLYYGAVREDKGVEDLCIAVENTNIKTLIISRNPIPSELNPYLYKTNIRWIVGYVKNIEDYVNRAKLVVLPYRTLKGTEGNPSCLLEAVACKTPVIISDLPEIEEIFDTEVIFPGLYRLYFYIKDSLKDYKNEKKRAEKAFKKIKDFSTEKIAKDFEAIYNE